MVLSSETSEQKIEAKKTIYIVWKEGQWTKDVESRSFWKQSNTKSLIPKLIECALKIFCFEIRLLCNFILKILTGHFSECCSTN